MKKPRLNLSQKIDLQYLLSHPGIPKPIIGFSPNWEEKHKEIPNLIADHRHCPSIMVREQIGITLFMPYTCRFFRDGRIEVETYWEDKKPNVFQIKPIQSKVKINPKSEEAFPGFHTALPGSEEMLFPLHLFVLGDIRVNSWIIQSGVQMLGLPNPYTLGIFPIPYFDYPQGVSVGQGLVYTLENINGLLKIPIDLDFNKLPLDRSYIEIQKGSPMVQYLPMTVPEITLAKGYARENYY